MAPFTSACYLESKQQTDTELIVNDCLSVKDIILWIIIGKKITDLNSFFTITSLIVEKKIQLAYQKEKMCKKIKALISSIMWLKK